MLVNNVGGERSAASMVKDSLFYIELAKFVQAYSMIVLNPNNFLKEVGEASINEDTDFLTWAQFVKIMQGCDLGFSSIPTERELVVFYNYALEMGSLGTNAKKVASVEDVANAQKHYYNFIDESTDRAELNYAKQQQISNNRDREARQIGKNLSSIRAKNITTLSFMVLGVVIFTFGLVSLFWDNIIARSIFGFVNSNIANVFGGIVLMVIGVVIFAILHRLYLKTKYAYLKLKDASKTIFERSDSAFNDTLVLKNKLDGLKNDLKVVKNELKDKNKSYDVVRNIEKLSKSNKYYKQFVSSELLFDSSEKISQASKEELSNVKLSKEEYENVRNVGKEAIILNEEEIESGTLEAANKIKEVMKEEAKVQEEESEEIYDEFVGENDDKEIIMDAETERIKETEKLKEAERLQRERAQQEQASRNE